MTKILDRPQVSLSLLLKLGFSNFHVSNKCVLQFMGISAYLANQNDVEDLLIEEKINLILFQSVIRACCRTDENMTHTFDTHDSPLGHFVQKQCSLKDWQNYNLVEKIQIAMCLKEIYNIQNSYDIFILRISQTDRINI